LLQYKEFHYSANNKISQYFVEWFDAWWAGELEVKRLAEAGVNPFVVRDAFSQVHLDQLNWVGQARAILTRDWTTDMHLKWFLRNEAGQLVSKNYVKPDPEREEVVFVSIERIRRILRPFAGLIHMKNFKDGLRISDKNNKLKKTPGNETLIEFELNGKNIMFTPELLSKFSKVFIRREVGSNFELYPNMKMLFVVRDPRSMISARLRFVQSLAARKNQFYAQLQYWYQLNKDLISLCDQYPGKCIIVRYEDLVIRPHYTIEDIIHSKLGFNFERIEEFEPFERVPNFNLTWWAKYLPDIIEPAMVDMISLLQRLGYNPTRTDIEQYETKDLAPR